MQGEGGGTCIGQLETKETLQEEGLKQEDRLHIQ